MKTKPMHYITRVPLIVAALLGAANFAGAQTTNWVAYNNHRSGPIVPPHVPTPTSWGTAPNVTTIDMGDPGNTSGPLTDFLTGNPLTATLNVARIGTSDAFGTIGRPVPTNTPMARVFLRICDLSIDGLVGVRTNATDYRSVTLTFGGLDPSKRYVFRGTTARNGGYGNRWSVATISAEGWTDAHINGATGPGVLTANNFPAGALSPGQGAWNSGANSEGAVVGWNDIAPFPDGTFTITADQYTGALPGGIANNGPYGYSFTAMMLAEVEIVAPAIAANPTASTTVEQNRPFSLSVAATGAPLNYQWYKGLGEISGATFPTYSVPQAQVSDSGLYSAVVYNALARRTSTVAQVTVFADTTAPAVETIFSYPTVDAGGIATLDQIIIEFNEPVTSGSVSSPASYTVPGGGRPASVIVTNERSVVLLLGTPLAEDTDYSVTLSAARDAVGNVAGSSSAPFHSWVSGIGNGLLMESYNVEDAAITVESLLADSDYPNNPFRRDTLRAFDSRLVFPDNTQEGYGARIRGVFIPPVSGDWVFFARMDQLGVIYLNPNGTDEAGKVEILRQSTENPPFNWDRLSSSLQSLRAGRAYYIEGLYKSATGEDFMKVAARPAGTGVPLPVDSLDTEVDANSLAGAAIAFPLAPRNLGGPLTLVQDLQNVTGEENHLATFAVQVTDSSGLPIFYQWFRDGGAIAGANGPSYSVQVTSADNGATFRVQIAKIGALTNSRTATLTVVPDITGPVLLSVKGDDSFSKIFLTWNEAISPDAAQEAGSYKILAPNLSEIPVLNATLANGSNVVLTLATRLQQNTTYSLEAAFQTDVAQPPNLTVKVGNPTVDSTHGVVMTLRSFVITPGLTRFQAYLGLSSAGTLDGFITSPVYPDGATFSFYTNVLNWPQSVPNFDQYAMRLTGLFVAPETGLHRFDPAHDDDARLRVYASDDPAGTFTELLEPGVSAFGADGTVDASLVAGQRYYYELIVREFGGADYAGIAVTLPSAAVSSPIAGQYLEAATDPGSGTPAAPRIASRRSGGNLVITWPASVTGFALETAPTIPSATWTPVNSTVVNGENTASIPIPASGNAFYRLRQ